MPRSIWNGAIVIGLIDIPIKLYPATRQRRIPLHMMSGDRHVRLRQRLTCPETGRAYQYEETVRGYEIAPDQYVILTPQELESLRPTSESRAIEISEFVDLHEIDPIYFGATYYVMPEDPRSKAYQVLLQAMQHRSKVGIGKFVMRDRQYLAALRPLERVIALEAMRFAEEIIDPSELPEAPVDVPVTRSEQDAAERLIDVLTTEFQPGAHTDEYHQRLRRLIEQKARGEQVHIELPVEAPVAGEGLSFMEALELSVEQAMRTGARRTRGHRRRRTA